MQHEIDVFQSEREPETHRLEFPARINLFPVTLIHQGRQRIVLPKKRIGDGFRVNAVFSRKSERLGEGLDGRSNQKISAQLHDVRASDILAEIKSSLTRDRRENRLYSLFLGHGGAGDVQTHKRLAAAASGRPKTGDATYST